MADTVWKVCGAAMVAVTAGLLLRQLRGASSGALRVAATVLLFGLLAPKLGELIRELTAMFGNAEMEEYGSVMVRSLGVATLTQLCGDICRDCGESGTAQGVELAGKLTILSLCLPLLRELLGYAAELLEMG